MAWTLENGPIQLTNLSHVGVAVKSAEQTVKFLSTIWNVGDPEVFDYTPKEEELFAGDPFSVRLVFVKFGPLTIELLEPLDDRSIWSKFIAEKGEGIHHIALGVSNYDEVVERTRDLGHPLLVSAVFEGCRWCYFETSPGGMVIEYREEYPRS
ncbi:MAG TPA: VOC family protein [Solirubrobacteraceae bacterium]|nr:VOC family protein [Solirubrobacteraceae bacterium]